MAATDDIQRAASGNAPTGEPAPARADSGELSDEQLDKVSGGQAAETTAVSNVLKQRHDTAKNAIGNVR